MCVCIYIYLLSFKKKPHLKEMRMSYETNNYSNKNVELKLVGRQWKWYRDMEFLGGGIGEGGKPVREHFLSFFFFFFLRFYLFIHREAETQAEGEAGSMQRA